VILKSLLEQLYKKKHRALIFSQMTKMLDILENFLDYLGYSYLRFDGSTSVDDRQVLIDQYNSSPHIFIFLLSTRAGGLGVNLVGADTVIFYDSDWNPSMDQQAQDRCHRIGQTREVHIYRLISVKTVEENILKKSKQKVSLQKAVIKQGQFTTDFFQSVDLKGLVKDENARIEAIEETLAEAIARDNVAEDWGQNVLAQVEDETDAEATKRALEEEKHEFDDEFSDDEKTKNRNKKNNHEKHADAAEPKKKKKKKILEKSDWEDQLTPVQKYALHFLENINPVIDEEALVSQTEALELNEQKWAKTQREKIHNDTKQTAAQLSEKEAADAKSHYQRLDKKAAANEKRKRTQSQPTTQSKRARKPKDDDAYLS